MYKFKSCVVSNIVSLLEEMRGVCVQVEERVLQETGWAGRTLEEELERKQGEFAGLLTREDALDLVAREKGLEAERRGEKAATPLAEIKPGDQQVAALARVWHVFATKHFSKKTAFGERAGKVRNVLVKDASGEATLVLWGKDAEWPEAVGLRRNSSLRLYGAASKLGTRGLELHSSLTTRLLLSAEGEEREQEKALPTYPAKTIAAHEISREQEDADVKGVITRLGRKTGFTRVKKTGETEKSQVFDCWLEAGGKQVRLVAWDSNALVLETAKAGDKVVLEGGSVRNSRDGSGFEVHAGWASHIVLEKSASSNAAIAGEVTLVSKLAGMQEGAAVLVEARVKSVSNAWSLLKCSSCGSKTPLKAGAESNCSCGGNYNKLFVVRAALEDGTGGVESVFFNEQALALLGLNAIPLDNSAIIDLKKEEAEGKPYRFQLKLKKSHYTSEMEGVASAVSPLPTEAPSPAPVEATGQPAQSHSPEQGAA